MMTLSLAMIGGRSAGLRVRQTPTSRLKKRRKTLLGGKGEWPAPGSEDTELGVFMGPEVNHGKAEVYTRVQA